MLDLVSSVKDDAEEHGESTGSKVDHLHIAFAERCVRLSERGPREIDVGDVIAKQVKQCDFISIVVRHTIASKLV